MKPVEQEKERWEIFMTNDTNFRISKDIRTSFTGTETECKKWIEENYNPIEFKVNELLKTITFLTKD